MVAEWQIDEQLVRRFQGGDQRAFEDFVKRHQDRIFRLCATFVRPEVDPADACQEVFVRAYTGLPRFRFRAKPFTWLYGTAKNVCRELNRKVKSVSLGSGDLPELAAHPQFMETDLTFVRRLVSELPERQRDVVILRIFEDLSVAETAKALGIRAGTVKAHLHKALRNLMVTLKKLGIEESDYD
ncbi:MAG: sigma-70 family RNA polymerase sigma factor [Pseudomonadota bacterium]